VARRDTAGHRVHRNRNYLRPVNADRGISNYDRPFNNVTSIVYQLPFGRGRKFMGTNSRLIDSFLGGWDIKTILNMRSGEPFTLAYIPNAQQQVVPVISVLGRNSYRPNVSGPVMLPSGTRSPAKYLNSANISLPAYSTPFGNAGRNNIRGHAYYQDDLGISKNFQIRDQMRILFRAEAFNLFNHSNFTAPDGNISNPTFGVITSTYPPRQMQFALKVQF
jgi:hypothetical protein